MHKRKRRVQKSQPTSLAAMFSKGLAHLAGFTGLASSKPATLAREAHAQNRSVNLIEPLESRVLLTTLVGGDVFYYLDAQGQTIRVSLTGNAIIELIAAAVDTSSLDQPLILGNMPGQLTGDRLAGTGVEKINLFGGLGGADAVRVIGPTSFTDAGNSAFNSAVANSTTFKAIATSATGARTWGIDVGSFTVNDKVRTVVNLVGFDITQAGSTTATSGQTKAFLQEATLGEDILGKADLKGVAANFTAVAMRDSSTIFAINQEQITIGGFNQSVAVLYQFSASTGAQLSRGLITNTSDNFGAGNVALNSATSLAFDSSGNLFFTSIDYDGLSNKDTSGFPAAPDVPISNLDPGLVRISTLNATFGQFTNADVSLITSITNNSNFEITYPINGLTYDATNNTFVATAAAVATTGSTLFNLANVSGSAPTYGSVVQIQNEVTLNTGGNNAASGFGARGLAFSMNINYKSTDYSDQRILVAAIQDRTGTGSLLAAIDQNTGLVTPLSSVGSISDNVLGLTSVTTAGDARPMIYTIDRSTGRMIRGSTISMMVDASGATTVSSVQGAALDPATGELYYVARETHTFTTTTGKTVSTTTAELDGLYHLDPTQAGRSRIQNSLQAVGTNHFGQTAAKPGTVQAISFDGSGDLWAFSAKPAVGTTTPAEGVMSRVSLDTSALSDSVSVTEAADNITSASGIAFIPGSPDTVYITTGTGTGTRLIRANLLNGRSVNLGLLTDPSLTPATGETQVPGQNIGDITFNPFLIDPFTGEVGALVGTDTGTNQLIFIDRRLRFSNANLFTIYVSQTDGNATLSVTSVTGMGTSSEASTPFTGTSGNIAVLQSNIILTGSQLPYTTISAPANSGQVFLGAKGLFNIVDKDDPSIVYNQKIDVPYLSAFLEQSIGTRAAGLDDFLLYRDPTSPFYNPDLDPYLIAPEDNLTPGVIVGESLLNFYATGPNVTDRLLGSGFGSVQGLSSKTNGQLFAISSSSGQPVIAQIGADGKIIGTSARNVLFNGAPISTVYGMDFGDIGFTGVETLYAVVSLTTGGPANLVTIDPTTGAVTAIGALGNHPITGIPITSIDAVSVSTRRGSISPSQRGIYVAYGDIIQEVNPASGGVIASQYAVLSYAGDPAAKFDIGSMDFNQFNQLTAVDTLSGRLTDINMATFSTHLVSMGSTLKTPAGSVRPTVGAITFDLSTNRYLGTDNATTIQGSTVVKKAGQPTFPITAGSAALMTFNLVTGASAQNMDSILIDGTVTGRVDISGSLNTFWAGWLITGDARGNVVGNPESAFSFDIDGNKIPTNVFGDQDRTEAAVLLPGNFLVGGDLGSLLVGTHIGTDASGTGTQTLYYTGTDIVIKGRAETIKALGTLNASVDVQNNTVVAGGGRSANFITPTVFDFNTFNYTTGYSSWSEIESQKRYTNDTAGIAFWEGRLNNAALYNDTIETAQYLGSLRSSGSTLLQVSGILQSSNAATDKQDFYAVSLLAGQTITIYTDPSNPVGFFIYDPDGRKINSDYANGVSAHQVRFTADRPGTYSIGVFGGFGAGAYSAPDTNSYLSDFEYTLTVETAGDIALASLHAGADLLLTTGPGSTQLWGVRRGDLGSLTAGSGILAEALPNFGYNVNVINGNIRNIMAGSIGDFTSPDQFFDFEDSETSPFLNVPNGSVGLIKSTTGDIRLNMNNFERTGYGATPNNGISIGGNYQTIQAAGNLAASLYSRKGIGVIRAATILNDTNQSRNISASYEKPFEIRLNTDSTGNDGVIDLISTTGDWGNIADGGAPITTGPGGNVRYMSIGGTLWGDRFFGSATIDPSVQLDPGQSYQFKDDSGNVMTLTPTSNESEVDVDTGETIFLGAQLTVLAYGIRGSGGSVIVRLESTGGLSVSGNGGEISSIEVEGVGQALVFDPETNQLVVDESETSVETPLSIGVAINGSAPIDVYSITAGTVDYITNNTGGEIVSVDAGDVGSLFSAGTLGLARSTTGAIVNGHDVFDNSYPFVDQRFGIKIAHALNIQANLSLGNIIVTSAVTTIRANADGTNTSGSFEGIRGPIVLLGESEVVEETDTGTGTGTTNPNEGKSPTDIFESTAVANTIDIGEGLAPLWAGDVGNTGIFAVGLIRNIISNSSGNIYGPIVSQTGIQAITLNGGSIINAQILTTDDFSDAIVYDIESVILTDAIVGNITINGNGGIIGTSFLAGNFLNTTVTGGFGIINSQYRTLGQGTMGNFTVDGLGIRYAGIIGGADVGNINATGTGKTLTISTYSSAVRQSVLSTSTGPNGALYDSTFNVLISSFNDLNVFIAETGSSTNSGIIDQTSVRGNRNLGFVSADRITNSEFNFANYIAGITARSKDAATDSISNVSITTGELGQFNTQGDLSALSLTVAGVINSVNIQGSLLGGSKIAVVGPGARLGTVIIKNDLVGTIFSNGAVTSINIGGNLEGNITISPFTPAVTALNSLTIGGSWTSGLIDITGGVNTITAGGSFGTFTKSNIVIDGNLNSLTVGQKTAAGALVPPSLGAELQILGKATTINVAGQVEGAITVRGTLGTLTVDATKHSKLLNTSILDNKVSVGGGINTVTVTAGDVAGDINGGDAGIRNFTLRSGDLLATASLAAGKGGIGSINLTTGNFEGASVLVQDGTVASIRVGGKAPFLATIETGNLTNLTVAGDIAAGTSIKATGILQTLNVAGTVQTGADFEVGKIGIVTTSGDFFANLTADYNPTGSRFTVRNLGGQIHINGNATINVKGNIQANSSLIVGENMTLTVAGTIGGAFIVGEQATQIIALGSILNLTAGSIFNSVVTSGFDIRNLRVSSNINNSLIQAGISPGKDGIFASTEGQKDAGEQNRPGKITSLSAASVNNSIINAGGSISNANIAGTLRDSSISAGLNLGSFRIRAVIDAPTLLSTDAGRALTRIGSDRTMFRGDITNARIAGTLVNADVTAGVDAGADGEFGTADDSSILVNGTALPYGGGTSKIGNFFGVGDGASHVLADAGVGGNPQGVIVNKNVTFDVEDLGPLGTLVRTITASDKAVTVDGVTFQITGIGTLKIYDNVPGSSSVDSVVISGSNAGTSIRISGGAASSIGRVIATDDTVIGTLNAYGIALTGAVPGSIADLWLEGATNVSLGNLGNEASGAISGQVMGLTIKNQGSGLIRVDGGIGSVTVEGGTGYAIEGASYSTLIGSGTVTGAASDMNAASSLFYIRNGRLINVGDATAFGAQTSSVVIDKFSGATVIGVDLTFTDVGTSALALANARSYAPVVQATGALNAAGIGNLRSLAVNANGEAFTIGTNATGQDVLVRISSSGVAQVIGTLQDAALNTFGSEVETLAFDNIGGLYATIHYSKDYPDATRAGMHAIAKISTLAVGTGAAATILVSSPTSTLLLPQLLNIPFSETNRLTSITFQPSTNTIYGVQRNTLDTQDTLVNITLDGQVTNVGTGTIQIAGANTRIRGIGFDDLGNLLALNENATDTGSSIIGLKGSQIFNPAAFTQVTQADRLSQNLTAFATGRGAIAAVTYAFDLGSADFAQGKFFSGTGATLVPTIGTLQTQGAGVGQFLPLSPVLSLSGQPVTLSAVAIAELAGSTYVVLSDGQILKINASGTTTAQGRLHDGSTGQNLVASDLFVTDTDELVAVDSTSRRFVFVDTTDADLGETRPRTEIGSVAAPFKVVAVNNTDGTVFSYNSSTGSANSNKIVQLRGTGQAELGGLVANYITRLAVTGASTGRIATVYGPLTNAKITGNFNGSLSTGSTIGNLTINGDLNGFVYAAQGISSILVTGAVASTGGVDTGGNIGSFTQSGTANFAGTITARTLGSVTSKGTFTGSIYTTGTTNSVNITNGKNFSGALSTFGLTRLTVAGAITAGATAVSHGTFGSLTVGTGIGVNALVYADGKINTINVKGTTSGMVIANGGFGTATFQHLTQAIITAGASSGTLRVTGNTINSIVSIGTLHQQDADNPLPLFNTATDLIVGGTLTSATFTGTFTDSVLAAGVLPNVAAGSVMPSTITALNFNTYLTDSTASKLFGPPDIGGPVLSGIGSVTINGLASTTSTSTGRRSAIVSADQMGKVTIKQGAGAVAKRVYDTLQSLRISSATAVSATELRVVFNQTLNADTVVRSTSIFDDLGTVLLTDELLNVIDATVIYTTETQTDGSLLGVIRIITAQALPTTFYELTLFGRTTGVTITGPQTSTRAEITELVQLKFIGNGQGVDGGDSTIRFSNV